MNLMYFYVLLKYNLEILKLRITGRGNEIYCRPPGFFCGAFRLQ